MPNPPHLPSHNTLHDPSGPYTRPLHFAPTLPAQKKIAAAFKHISHALLALNAHMQYLENRGVFTDQAVRWYLYEGKVRGSAIGGQQGDMRGFLEWCGNELVEGLAELRRGMEGCEGRVGDLRGR
ncbi:hypothetical protein GLAREA_05104 [Glarea lozoyensis ATCC 20868]|uniref:Uncharacterized protein n=1 Tax=Glarea lozoyensis (strain ATCC 20868 / MF5171) TaxID=1116229 RepID=S3DV10_GLAL2|nr:uncharacterized protein GLAREA_05104 [Glarea lozoyensis ATCC 20868]EPE35766.1 hypothetical protein GLAREA_05104 [Glarea lozoyensis ATCC 20868]